MQKGGYTCILTNIRHTVLYVGATSCLERRLYEHQNHLVAAFTSKHILHEYIYYEHQERIEDVITREKQLQG